ncbi:MAG: hypothetical protein HW403_198 [Dehalococcoidia bacterium]|nr:hypothetical protein [Dehalococcoidia bacterium]
MGWADLEDGIPTKEHIYQIQGISPQRQAFDRALIRGARKATDFTARHWLFMMNSLNLAMVLGVVLAPLFAAVGWLWPANLLYTLYDPFCHQLPQRSFFIFGQQFAVCQRDIAIYTAFLVAGLLFLTVRHRLRPLPWWLFILFAAPMAVDGFTQLFGWRESAWELRLITGFMFGIGATWVTYPYMERLTKDVLFPVKKGGEAIDSGLGQ